MTLCCTKRGLARRTAGMLALITALPAVHAAPDQPGSGDAQRASTVAMSARSSDGDHRNRLHEIIHTQCVPHWLAAKDPSPCLRVTLTSPEPTLRGFGVLPDRKGGAHLLLIPLEPVSGIESADAWERQRPNYFQYAWEARDTVAQLAGRSVPRAAIGLAINSMYTRSQDQLHIHMACLNSNVHDLLVESADEIGTSWRPLVIRGIQYQAQRVMGTDLGDANPFTQLAQGVPGAKDAMGAYTLLVAGMDFKQGPGFVLLAAKFAPGSELLLDPSCALAH
jgi:CDP-diacylglycerol pyrophosphatase